MWVFVVKGYRGQHKVDSGSRMTLRQPSGRADAHWIYSWGYETSMLWQNSCILPQQTCAESSSSQSAFPAEICIGKKSLLAMVNNQGYFVTKVFSYLWCEISRLALVDNCKYIKIFGWHIFYFFPLWFITQNQFAESTDSQRIEWLPCTCIKLYF